MNPNCNFIRIMAVIAVVFLSAGGGSAQLFFEQDEQHFPADPNNLAQYGKTVDIDGDTMAIGADFDGQSGTNAGAVYIRVRNAGVWTTQQKVQPSDAGPSKFFGRSVALDGDTLAVGAVGDSGDSGAVYVFTRSGTTWTQQQKLVGSEVTTGNQFGNSVDVQNDTLLAGVNAGQFATGYVTVFNRTGVVWSEDQVLTATDESGGDAFGFDVSLDGDVAIFAAHRNDDLGHNAGTAYIFRRNAGVWEQEKLLTGSDTLPDDIFGFSVAIEGATAVVGAYQADPLGGGSGEAYIFEYNGSDWIESATLTSSDGSSLDQFGRCVAIDGGVVVVTAARAPVSGEDSGAGYVFEKVGGVWTEVQKFFPGDPVFGLDFGVDVAISGDSIAAGGPNYAEGSFFATGTAYSFTRTAASPPGEPTGPTPTPTVTPEPSSSVSDWGIYD